MGAHPLLRQLLLRTVHRHRWMPAHRSSARKTVSTVWGCCGCHCVLADRGLSSQAPTQAPDVQPAQVRCALVAATVAAALLPLPTVFTASMAAAVATAAAALHATQGCAVSAVPVASVPVASVPALSALVPSAGWAHLLEACSLVVRKEVE